MNSRKIILSAMICFLFLCGGFSFASLEGLQNKICNGDFTKGLGENELPIGWIKTSLCDTISDAAIIFDSNANSILLSDQSDENCIGIEQSFDVNEGQSLDVWVNSRVIKPYNRANTYIAINFEPSNKTISRELGSSYSLNYEETFFRVNVPGGTKRAKVTIATTKESKGRIEIANIMITGADEPAAPAYGNEIVPPQYNALKKLHIETEIVSNNSISQIVIPDTPELLFWAKLIQAKIKELTGVKIEIKTDVEVVPFFPGNFNYILLGNRSNNKIISFLYDRHYALTDLKYPGQGGYEVRTLHNIFGSGRNVVLIGGSDIAGLKKGVSVFVEKIVNSESHNGQLSIGWLMEICLGDRFVKPENEAETQIWSDTPDWNTSGYWGWNRIAKLMALYYMTGNESFAKDFLRLAFPDQKTIEEMEKIDKEMIEDKKQPLSAPYHYGASYMILYWDLIEESPFFDDQTRLRITNAFAKQLSHWADEMIYDQASGKDAFPFLNRHIEYSALSLYCLARYFEQYYPSVLWEHCLETVKYHHRILMDPMIVGFHSTGTEFASSLPPLLTYVCISGDRTCVENGSLEKIFKDLETCIDHKGRVSRDISCMALNAFNILAYLTDNGRWLYYRDKLRMDTDIFRLGQSYWPNEKLNSEVPDDLINNWNVDRITWGQQMWQAREIKIFPEHAFHLATYRNTLDSSGDFIRIIGWNDGRLPPFASNWINELCINGYRLLKESLVSVSNNGVLDGCIPMDSGLINQSITGPFAIATCYTPGSEICESKRTILHKAGQFCVFIDEFDFAATSKNAEISSKWGMKDKILHPKDKTVLINGENLNPPPADWIYFAALDNPFQNKPFDPYRRGNTSLSDIVSSNSAGRAGARILKGADHAGDFLEMTFELVKAVKGQYFVELYNRGHRRPVSIYLDDNKVIDKFIKDSPTESVIRVNSGIQYLGIGKHKLRIEVAEEDPKAGPCYIGLSGLLIKPEGVSDEVLNSNFSLIPSDDLKMEIVGNDVCMSWRGEVKKGCKKNILYLLVQKQNESKIDFHRIADNAVYTNTPQKAIIISGDFENTKADYSIISEDYIYAHNTKQAGIGGLSLLKSNEPVEIFWDFKKNVLEVKADKPCIIWLCKTFSEVDGAVAAQKEKEIIIDSNKSLIKTEFDSAIQKKIISLISNYASKKIDDYNQNAPKINDVKAVESAKISEIIDVNSNISRMISFKTDTQEYLAVAEGRALHLFDENYKEVSKISTDAPVQAIHWWADKKLLLLGCENEKVSAFNDKWEKAWSFTSIMAPEIYETGKYYWYRSWPGHGGIHGLFSGIFDHNESRAFIGTACTIEIIDSSGQLIKRVPTTTLWGIQGWGPSFKFLTTDAEDNSVNLIAARKPNGFNSLSIINSKSINLIGTGFDGVPKGQTDIKPWMRVDTVQMYKDDIDNDSRENVIIASAGAWNRVTVYSEKGTALYNANFGENKINDMDIMHCTKQTSILICTNKGLLAVLDCYCKPLWSKIYGNSVEFVRAINNNIMIACKNGEIIILNQDDGSIISQGRIAGRPIEALTTNKGVLVAGETGKVFLIKE